jgi:cysteine desulfurase
MLARVPLQDGVFDRVSYLFGVADERRLLAAGDVAYAFTGSVASERLASVVGPRTVLCAAGEAGSVPCTTLAAPVADPARQLDPYGVEEFLRAHPDAILVDVREAYEQLAARSGSWQGHKALSVPLSRLADCLPAWLGGADTPLVFFCRSGARSARAAECLQRLGYQSAWYVTGGAPQVGIAAKVGLAA